MSHFGMTQAQSDAYQVNKPIVILDDKVGTVKFGVDNVDTVERNAFPAKFHVLDSVDFITYDQVLKAFTDEETFFGLQCVMQLTGENQRYVGPVELDEGDGPVNGIIITLPGIIDPAEAFSLYTEVQKAGHYMAPAKRFGQGGCTFTVFKIIPKV